MESMLQPAAVNVLRLRSCAVVSPVPPALVAWPVVAVFQKLALTVPPLLNPMSPPMTPLAKAPLTEPVA